MGVQRSFAHDVSLVCLPVTAGTYVPYIRSLHTDTTWPRVSIGLRMSRHWYCVPRTGVTLTVSMRRLRATANATKNHVFLTEACLQKGDTRRGLQGTL